MLIVVATDVASHFKRRAPQAWPFIDLMAGYELLTFFDTVAEIEHGMARAR